MSRTNSTVTPSSVAAAPRPSLGSLIRQARKARGRTGHELSRFAQITPSYLSDIENDRRTPAEPLLRRLSVDLDLSVDDLLDAGGKLGWETEEYVKAQPLALRLLRRIARCQLSEEEIASLIVQIDQRPKMPQARTRSGRNKK